MSYASQQFLIYDSSTLANFKLWAQAISSALSSSGWVLTSDTGQVNWGSIASVPAFNSYVYEIWKPADALQTGSTQFFLRVEYGKTNGSPAAARARFSIGAGTDGAGTLTGLVSSIFDPMVSNGVGQGSSLTWDSYFSGDTDRFGMLLWRSGGVAGLTPCFVIAIERTHNTDGTNSSDGVTIICVNKSNLSRGPHTLVFGIGMAVVNTAPDNNGTYAVIGWDCTNASGAFNNNIPVFPEAPIYGKVGNPMTEVAWVHAQDVAEGCVFTTTLYGATRTYIASNFGSLNVNSPTSLNTGRVCLRYD